MKLKWNAKPIPPIKGVFSWSEPYADDVHNGAFYVGGVRGVARPWTEITLSRINIPHLFKRYYSGDVHQAFQLVCFDINKDFKDVINYYEWDIDSPYQKQFKDLPTWNTITDSGALVNSQNLTFDFS